MRSGDAGRSPAPGRIAPLLVGTAAAGWRVVGGGVTGSTQDDARALAHTGDPGPVVVLAERQTAGRGRLGRGWESPVGGVYFSALVRPSLALRAACALPLAAGLGIARGLEAAFGEGLGITLKWPNDLRVSGSAGSGEDSAVPTPRKLAGVLAESAVVGDRLAWVVVGCGINVSAPGSPAPGAAWLADVLGDRPDPARVAAAAIAGLAETLDTLALVGFGALEQEYVSRSDIIGTEVTVRDAEGRPVASGVVTGFDEIGRLVLSAGGREVAIAAGEVTLRG